MVHKTDGELGRITTSFGVQCISHGSRTCCFEKTGTIQHTTMLLAAAKCTRLSLCVGVNRLFFVFPFVLRERHRAAPQSPNAPDTHSPSEEDGRVAIVRVRIFNVSVENLTCEAFTENTCRRFGPCGRQLVMSWMELNLCGAADAGGVDGKTSYARAPRGQFLRIPSSWTSYSHSVRHGHRTTASVVFTCMSRRQHQQVATQHDLSMASSAPVRLQKFGMHPTSLHSSHLAPPQPTPPKKKPSISQTTYQCRFIHLVFTKLIYLGPELETFSCTTHIVSRSFCSIHAECCSGSICERAKFHHSTRFSAI